MFSFCSSERQDATLLGLAVDLLSLLTLCEQLFLRLPVYPALLTLQSHQELCFPQSCRCLGIPAPDREESQAQQKHAACMEKTLLFLPRNEKKKRRKKFLTFHLSTVPHLPSLLSTKTTGQTKTYEFQKLLLSSCNLRELLL